MAPLPCASVKFYRRCADCDDEKTCEVRRLMREVRDAASAVLDNTSLAEAASVNAPKRKKKKEAAWIERYRQLWAARFDELDMVVEELKRKEKADGRRKTK